MFKRILISLLAALMLSSGLVAATSAPAAADGRTCVSKAEFDNVWFGYPRFDGTPATMGQVRSHFDTKGVVMEAWGGDRFSANRDIVRAYRKCPEWGPGYAVVWFDNYSWNWQQRVYAMAPSVRAYNLGNMRYW